jgi:hypothetical protein
LLARLECIHLSLHAGVKHAGLDRLDDAADLLLDFCQLRPPGIGIDAAFAVQPVALLGIGAHRRRRDLRRHHPVPQAGKHPLFQLLARDRALVAAGAVADVAGAGEAVDAAQGVGAAAAATDHQTRQQRLRPVGAGQPIALVMRPDRRGQLDVAVGDLVQARPDRLPELIVDDAQLRHLGDNPLLRRVEARHPLAGSLT